jgi:[ribosomal protein S5]-alanine N-acetyltransferase
MPCTRIVSLDDAAPLAALVRANRAFLAPWEPVHDDDYFTAAGQHGSLALALEAYQRGAMVPLVILDEGGQPVGRININGIVRGASQSGTVGYWVSQSHNGRGFASAAVADVIQMAFTDLRLHRLEAGTLLHNTASQRVLLRNGFTPFAVAPSYLNIAGKWQDHILFQRLAPGH